jgi:uncharacterized protein YciI
MTADRLRDFVILLSPLRPFSAEVIEAHIAHLGRLDDADRLVLAGPFCGSPGGMIVVRAEDHESARAIADADPFVRDGFERYELRELERASRDNGYLARRNR